MSRIYHRKYDSGRAARRIGAAGLTRGITPGACVQLSVTLKTDETKRRGHGISWSFVIVTAHVGNGQGEVTGVDSSDLEGVQIAKTVALLRAMEDDRAWADLGLQGN